MSITKEALAASLNGREIGDEITDSEIKDAKNAGLVVIFGASDDLVELRGAIYDEVGAWTGTTLLIAKDGRLLPEIEDDEVRDVLKRYGVHEAVLAAQAGAVKITARWCEVEGYSWAFETAAPHSPFDIVASTLKSLMEGSDKFCRGIVIDLKELG